MGGGRLPTGVGEVRGSMTTVVTGFDESKNPVYKSFVDGVPIVKPFWDFSEPPGTRRRRRRTPPRRGGRRSGAARRPTRPAGPAHRRVRPRCPGRGPRRAGRRRETSRGAARPERGPRTRRTDRAHPKIIFRRTGPPAYRDADAAWRLLQQAYEADQTPATAESHRSGTLAASRPSHAGGRHAGAALLRDGLRESFDAQRQPPKVGVLRGDV